MTKHFRPGTDDDRFVIPEIVNHDMYRMPMMSASLTGIAGSIIDGGAHIGVTAAMFSRHFNNNNIFCYEPEPENFELLRLNTDGLSNVNIKNVALAHQAGSFPLWDHAGTGRFSCFPVDGKSYIECPAVSLAEEITINAPVLILKLDLEGYEAVLINSMPAEIWRHVEVLILESHPWSTVQEGVIMRAGFTEWFRAFADPRHTVYRKAKC